MPSNENWINLKQLIRLKFLNSILQTSECHGGAKYSDSVFEEMIVAYCHKSNVHHNKY